MRWLIDNLNYQMTHETIEALNKEGKVRALPSTRFLLQSASCESLMIGGVSSMGFGQWNEDFSVNNSQWGFTKEKGRGGLTFLLSGR